MGSRGASHPPSGTGSQLRHPDRRQLALGRPGRRLAVSWGRPPRIHRCPAARPARSSTAPRSPPPTCSTPSILTPASPGDGRALLAAAGFDVHPLPLDRDPRQLRGLISSARSPARARLPRLRRRNAAAIYTFVDAGNVLLQMSQADQTEPRPPFLPNSQTAHATDAGPGLAAGSRPRQHPLLAGVPLDADGNLAWKFPSLAGRPSSASAALPSCWPAAAMANSAALMEGAYAQGRFFLSAMPVDKPVARARRDQFNQAFFRNLHELRADGVPRQARPVKVTPSPGGPRSRQAPPCWRCCPTRSTTR